MMASRREKRRKERKKKVLKETIISFVFPKCNARKTSSGGSSVRHVRSEYWVKRRWRSTLERKGLRQYWMDGWMDERMDARMDEWKDGAEMMMALKFHFARGGNTWRTLGIVLHTRLLIVRPVWHVLYSAFTHEGFTIFFHSWMAMD